MPLQTAPEMRKTIQVETLCQICAGVAEKCTKFTNPQWAMSARRRLYASYVTVTSTGYVGATSMILLFIKERIHGILVQRHQTAYSAESYEGSLVCSLRK